MHFTDVLLFVVIQVHADGLVAVGFLFALHEVEGKTSDLTKPKQ